MTSVLPQVERVLQGEGISNGELDAMLERSAITSQRGYTRRYNDWYFRITPNGVVQKMARVDLLEVGTGTSRMMQPHDECNGVGCQICGWEGSIIRRVR